MMKKMNTFKVTTVGIGVVINIIGTLLALTFKIPLLMDSIGTIMVSALLGPGYGIATGLLNSIISGITFDIYSLYFGPVQIFVGALAGILYRKGYLDGRKRVVGVFFISTASALVGAIIAAYVFGGITSSSSTYIVVVLSQLGVNKVLSVFIVQFLMDYLDRFLAVSLVIPVTKALPIHVKQKLSHI